MNYIEKMGMKAKACRSELANASGTLKNDALLEIAHSLRRNMEQIMQANALDVKAAKERGMSNAMIDRLRLDHKRIESMAAGCEKLCALADPVGEVIGGCVRPNGMQIRKVRVPIGVIGMIYEARPNVTVDAAALCIKSGNAVILRGGKEAICSNMAIADVLREAVKLAGLPADCIQLVGDTSRRVASQMMKLNEYIDVLIPRGGAGLIKAVMENSTVPVIETGVGNCHVYVDKTADIDMAANIIFNAKTSRPSVCNAIETILVHKDIASQALPAIKARLDEKNVEIRGCDRTAEILGPCVVPVSEQDYAVEFLDYILACRVVDSIDAAIDHIAKYSTGHSECIVTSDYFCAEKFTAAVDSAAVYVNCSTRFTDGGEFGLGAEIGISTQKLHARGPMGIRQLTSSKFIIQGDGQIR